MFILACREINLSGNRRSGGNNKSKATSGGRRNLLINAEVQRKQRQEKIRRVNAAKFAQRVTRGHLSRLRTVEECSARVLASEVPAVVRLAALSVCLSYRSLLTRLGMTRKDLLLGFQRYTCNSISNHSQHQEPSVDIDLQPMEVVVQNDDGGNSSFSSSCGCGLFGRNVLLFFFELRTTALVGR